MPKRTPPKHTAASRREGFAWVEQVFNANTVAGFVAQAKIPTAGDLEEAARILNLAIALVSADPVVPSPNEAAQKCAAIRKQAGALLLLLGAHEPDAAASTAELLNDGLITPVGAVDAAIAALRMLESAAERSGDAYQAGVRKSAPTKGKQRALGTALVKAYVAATGRRAGRSNRKGSGEPSGPLFAFAKAAIEVIRRECPALHPILPVTDRALFGTLGHEKKSLSPP